MKEQTAKICFIIFLILFLIAAITAGIALKDQQVNKETATKAQAELAKTKTELSNWMREVESLKRMIDGKPMDFPLAEIEQKHGAKTTIYNGQTIPISMPPEMGTTYEKMVGYLAGTILEEQKKTALLKENLDQTTSKLTQRETLSQKAIAEHKATVDLTSQNLADTTKSFDDTISIANKAQADSKTALTTAITEADRANQASKAVAETATKTLDENIQAMETMGELLRKINRTTFEAPQGDITFVEPGQGFVYINLGEADNLKVRTTFSVFNPSVNDVAIAERVHSQELANLRDGNHQDDGICLVCLQRKKLNVSKASIEVIEILAPHLAKARVLVQEFSNPIVKGDVIFTPVWQPGDKKQYALIGDMDIPETRMEGRDATLTLIDLIRSNGSEVVCWIDKDGKINGQMTPRTNYIVAGRTDNLGTETMKNIAELRKQARNNGTVEVTLEMLLREMGWSPTTNIKGFGKFATPDDLKIGQRNTVAPKSTGTVSAVHQNDQHAKVSTGTVSKLFENQGVAPKSSPGSDSDLFRKRPEPGTSP